jgi:hypothetical protein
MCWFSVEFENRVEEATAGQRLAIRTMMRTANWHSNWVVRESELETTKPCPVCLPDQSRVLFRFSEDQQMRFQLGSEAEATFKMLKYPKRDIFEFTDHRQITLGDLSSGLIFDVLVVPGSEQLSEVLEEQSAVQDTEDDTRKENLFERLLAYF